MSKTGTLLAIGTTGGGARRFVLEDGQALTLTMELLP